MPLTDAEKEQVKYHLGYVGTDTGSELMLGIPRSNQLYYLIDLAVTKVKEINVPRVRSILCTLADLEGKMQAASCTLMVESVGDIKMRGTGVESYPEMLEREYIRWAYRLSDIIGAPPFPYSTRFAAHPPGAMAWGPQVRNMRVR